MSRRRRTATRQRLFTATVALTAVGTAVGALAVAVAPSAAAVQRPAPVAAHAAQLTPLPQTSQAVRVGIEFTAVPSATTPGWYEVPFTGTFSSIYRVCVRAHYTGPGQPDTAERVWFNQLDYFRVPWVEGDQQSCAGDGSHDLLTDGPMSTAGFIASSTAAGNVLLADGGCRQTTVVSTCGSGPYPTRDDLRLYVDGVFTSATGATGGATGDVTVLHRSPGHRRAVPTGSF